MILIKIKREKMKKRGILYLCISILVIVSAWGGLKYLEDKKLNATIAKSPKVAITKNSDEQIGLSCLNNKDFFVKSFSIDGRSYSNVDITIGFRGYKLHGKSGCNQFIGRITRVSHLIRFINIGSTKMLCDGETMQVEDAFLRALNTPFETIKKDGLIILNNQIEGISITLKNKKIGCNDLIEQEFLN